jgi:transcriptional regulator with XRE-family HTH domain
MTLEDAIAANIRAWRARRNFSQAQVADEMRELGFDVWRRQTAARTEQGERRATAGELVALAQVLGCTPASLLDLSQSDRVTFPSGKPITG